MDLDEIRKWHKVFKPNNDLFEIRILSKPTISGYFYDIEEETDQPVTVTISEFSEGVCQKMQNDSKIEKLKNMQFVRVNITQYNSNTKKLVGNVVYTDNRDEYNVFLICNVMGEKIKLENYRINKGEELGL